MHDSCHHDSRLVDVGGMKLGLTLAGSKRCKGISLSSHAMDIGICIYCVAKFYVERITINKTALCMAVTKACMSLG